MARTRYLILGAGVTGLSAAYHLKDDYIILEKESRVGGLCRTEVYDGFVFDHAIHVLFTNDEYASHFIREVLLKGEYHAQPRESWIYSKEVLTEFPFQAHLYGLPSDVVNECVAGLVEAKQNNDNEKPRNFEEWIYRTFGKGIAEHFMIPYNRKAWGYDVREMDYKWIDGRVPIPSIEEIIEGAQGHTKKEYGGNKEFWYPTRGGIESVAKGFLPYVKNIRLDALVTRIDASAKVVEVNGREQMNYEQMISTLPLPALVRLIEDVPGDVAQAARELKYNIVHTVNIGIGRVPLSDTPYHWIYFPEEQFVFYRVSFPMNVHPSNVPEGTSSIVAEVCESQWKSVHKKTLVQDTLAGLRKAGILRDDDPILFSSVQTLDPAYVIFDLEHRKNVDLIQQYLESLDIFSCGRFGAWEYLNIDQAILQGKKVVDAICSSRYKDIIRQ